MERYLRARGAEVLGRGSSELTASPWRPLAREIAAAYSTVCSLLEKIKQSQGSGKQFTLSFRGTQEQTRDLLAIANLLREAELLPPFRYRCSRRYRRAPRYHLDLEASPPRAPAAINFLTGGWLELYAFDVALELVRHARKEGRSADLLARALVRIPDAGQVELDLCIACEDKLVWIEAKTGRNFTDCLRKYKKVRVYLGVPYEHAFLLMSDFQIGDPIAASRADTAGMIACPLDSLKIHLVSFLAPAR